MNRIGQTLLLGLFCASITAAWITCDRNEPATAESDEHPIPPVDTGSSAVPIPAPAPPPVVARDAASLRPVIRTVGPADGAPEKIGIVFARPVVDDAPKEADPERTVIEITPPVPGTLRFTGNASLELIPESPLRPGTDYRLVLRSVERTEGEDEGLLQRPEPQGDAWEKAFTTPVFALSAVTLDAVYPNPPRVKLALRFTAEPRLKDLKSRARFTIGEEAPETIRFEPHDDDPKTVIAELSGKGVVFGKELSVTVAEGVRYKHDRGLRTAAFEHRQALELGKPMRVLAVVRDEGASGHYVDVICDDDAVPGRKRWYWNPRIQNSWRVSQRCMPDLSSAQEHIVFEPPVQFDITGAERGFRILGDFSRGDYTLSIRAGLHTEDGGMMRESHQDTQVNIPPRTPQVGFTTKGRYLPKEAWTNLPIRHMNLESVQVRIRHIAPRNLVHWMAGEEETAGEGNSDLIVDEEIAVESPPDELLTSWVDVASLVPDQDKGVYELTVEGGAKIDKSRIVITDLQLVAKADAQGPEDNFYRRVHVWALGSKDLRPRSGVSMRLVRKSGMVLARCLTDSSGACTLEPEQEQIDTARPFAVIAESGADLTYLKFGELRSAVSDTLVHGEAYLSERAYRVAAWTERGVYRPGETARLTALVRNTSNVAPERGLPVAMKLINPRGKELRTFNALTNDAGIVYTDLAFDDFADTGSWNLRFEIGGEPVASHGLQVEEFMPERMKVQAEVLPAEAMTGTPARVSVDAQYLFGGSADGSRMELRCELQPVEFQPKNNSGYRFGSFAGASKPRATALGSVEDLLDENGRIELDCPGGELAEAYAESAELVAQVSVFEAGSGRTTHTTARARLHPERYYIGLATDKTKVSPGEDIKVTGIVVDWKGNPVTDIREIDIELARLDGIYGYWWDEDLGRNRYSRSLRESPMGDRRVKVSKGRFQLTVSLADHAEGYLVRAVSGGARTELAIEGDYDYYWWGWWSGNQSRNRPKDVTPKPQAASWVDVTLPDEIKAGAPQTARFIAPFKGRALMTVESHEVLHSEWFDVEAGAVTRAFEVDTFLPNIYVTVFVVKDPHLDSAEAFLPDRAFGVSSARMTPEAYRQTVRVTAPSETRPNEPMTVTVDLGRLTKQRPRYVTVAAVDEGILQLTNFKTPNPLDGILTRKALGVQSFETVGWTLMVPPSKSSEGGDAEAAAPGRVQPVKPVALWSGLLEVPPSGKVSVTFDVPQYRGELRVMAVAAGTKRIGSAETSVKVRDPLVLQTTLPRFLTAGDHIEIPVFITNMSGDFRDVDVTLSAEPIPLPGVIPQDGSQPPPLRIKGPQIQRISLADRESGTVVFAADAVMRVGAAKVRVSASSGDLLSWDELDVPFRADGPEETIIRRVALDQGDTALTQHLRGWVPTTERSTLWVSNNPYGDSFSHLQFLIRYPYGCIEQTSSSTRPLLFVDKFVSQSDSQILAAGGLEERVMHGINRLLSMQTSAGGFGYWPGAEQPSYWGTAQVTHLMLEADALGYPVPERAVDDALSWMKDRVNSNQAERYDNWADFGYGIPYMHYVLAKAGRGQKAAAGKALADLKGGTGNQDPSRVREDLYFLMAALHLSGDRRYEDELRDPDTSPVSFSRSNDTSFYSDLRRRGVILSIYTDLFGADEGGMAVADHVAEALRSQGTSARFNTQELGWGLVGLGKHVAKLPKPADFEAPSLVRTGGELPPNVPQDRRSDRIWNLADAALYPELTLRVPSKGDGLLYLYIHSRGQREGAVWKAGGKSLYITRSYHDAEGNPLPASGPALGDLVVVRLTVKSTSGRDHRNVALVDRLPAGMEIENPRLGRSTTLNWLDPNTLWQVDYMNLRDDRIELFGTVPSHREATVVYAARAVTSGRFNAPPADAEAMYDPGIVARTPAQSLTIRGPWERYLAVVDAAPTEDDR